MGLGGFWKNDLSQLAKLQLLHALLRLSHHCLTHRFEDDLHQHATKKEHHRKTMTWITWISVGLTMLNLIFSDFSWDSDGFYPAWGPYGATCLEIRGPTSVSAALPGPTRSFPAASAILGIHLGGVPMAQWPWYKSSRIIPKWWTSGYWYYMPKLYAGLLMYL